MLLVLTVTCAQEKPVQSDRFCVKYVKCLSSMQIASNGGACDEDGWQYRTATGSSEARPANPTGQQGWAAGASPSASWRRRRWVRHRRKRQFQVLLSFLPTCMSLQPHQAEPA